ncbi:putative 3-hydroxyisobutyrate dehydrogenase, mitochondrial isoform X2 [Primulina tabacum]|uniref:putative 3-hydroxyisobutyrate dehydrogenase, mitochondrial isoform X2 n=1 Tax=Primulina tabacum TaxID=48773 RepID=UPI003F59E976
MASCSAYRRWLVSLYRGNSKIITSSILYNKLSWARMSSSSLVSSQFERVGFIGLGNMGSRMANNLIKAGYNVLVHDVNLDVMKKYSDNGILTKNSPFEVAEECDVVITMLPSSTHVMDVYTGRKGFLSDGNLLRPQLFIDSSTIDPQTSRTVSKAISGCKLKEDRGSGSPAILDAPVSGGVLSAETGSLTFMSWLRWFQRLLKARALVGGSEQAYMSSKPLLLSMGKNIIHCGGPGNGSAAKICNNLALAVSMLGVSEAFALGQSLGISAHTLTKIFNSSSARCWSSDSYNPVPGVMDGVPASRNYEGGFAAKLMAKDLGLAAVSAKEVGLSSPLTFLAERIFTELCNEGHGVKDFSCVFRHYFSGKDEL